MKNFHLLPISSVLIIGSIVAAGMAKPGHEGMGAPGSKRSSVQAKQKSIRPVRDALKLNPFIVTPPSPTKPDLFIEQLHIFAPGNSLQDLNRNINPGEAIGLACDIYNIGLDLGPGQNWKIGYYIDGTLMGTKDWIGDMSSGRGPRMGIVCTAPQQEGVHYFECRLDMDNLLAEMDKRNNREEIPFRVGPPTATSGDLPDLIVKEIQPDGKKIVVWVQNIGGGTAHYVEVLFYINDVALSPPVFAYGNDSEAPIPPGGFRTYTNYNWHFWLDKTFVYKAVVDPNNRIQESNESNNTLATRFAIR
jgi:hypothetical protein